MRCFYIFPELTEFLLGKISCPVCAIDCYACDLSGRLKVGLQLNFAVSLRIFQHSFVIFTSLSFEFNVNKPVGLYYYEHRAPHASQMIIMLMKMRTKLKKSFENEIINSAMKAKDDL